jgi:hypothetical protein
MISGEVNETGLRSEEKAALPKSEGTTRVVHRVHFPPGEQQWRVADVEVYATWVPVGGSRS